MIYKCVLNWKVPALQTVTMKNSEGGRGGGALRYRGGGGLHPRYVFRGRRGYNPRNIRGSDANWLPKWLGFRVCCRHLLPLNRQRTRTHVDAWHQCIMPGPIILICSNIKIMKYNYFFIEICIYRSRFDTQYIYPAKIFFFLANIIIDQAFKNVGSSAGDHRFDFVCLPCAPWVNWLARSQLKCPSGVFVLGARGMTLQWGSTPKLLPVGTVVIWPTKS